MLLFVLLNGYAQNVYDSRAEIPDKYKRNLSDIYENWDAWELGLKELETKMDKIVKFKGRIKENLENLLKVQKLDDQLGILT